MNESRLTSLNQTLQHISNQQESQRLKNILGVARNKFSAARALLDYLAFSEEHYKVSSVQNLVDAIEGDYYEVVKFLKHLDVHNFGQFIVGRKGKDSRIVWKFHPQSIGSLLLDTPSVLTAVPDDLIDYDGGVIIQDSILHSFFLRPDFNIKLELPSNFNRSDQSRFEKWLDTIPFD